MENETIGKVHALIHSWHKTLNVPQLKNLNTMLMDELMEIQELHRKSDPPPDYPPPGTEIAKDEASSSIRRPFRNTVGGLPGPAEDANQ